MPTPPDLRAAILTSAGDAASRLNELHRRADAELPNHTWLASELHHIRQVLQGLIGDALQHNPDGDTAAPVGVLSEGAGGVATTPAGPVGVHKPAARRARATKATVAAEKPRPLRAARKAKGAVPK